MPKSVLDFPKISVKLFRNSLFPATFLQGSLNWITSEGVKVTAIYDFGIVQDAGYLALRFNDPTDDIHEVDYCIQLKPYLNNYKHRVWQFICPGCRLPQRHLYYIDGPFFTCSDCGKLNCHTTIKGFEKAKKDFKQGSPKRKLRALERLIQLREAVKRAKTNE